MLSNSYKKMHLAAKTEWLICKPARSYIVLTITIFDRLKPTLGYLLPWEFIYSSWAVAGKEFVVWQLLYNILTILCHI